MEESVELIAHPMFLTQALLLAIILAGAPLYARWLKGHASAPLKGLNLPEGSIRGMLALLIIGSFVNVLMFGESILKENFEQVITAFGTLAGAVTGFYFAGRKAP